MKFQLKLLIGLLAFFGMVIGTMLLWEPAWCRYYEHKLSSDDPADKVAAVEGFISMGKAGRERLKHVFPDGPRAAELLLDSWDDLEKWHHIPAEDVNFRGRWIFDTGEEGAVQMNCVHISACRGYNELLRIAKQRGVDLNGLGRDISENSQARPVFIYSKYLGGSPLAMALLSRQEETFETLLELGADPDVWSESLPLFVLAARVADVPVCALLLQAGVDIDSQEDSGHAALHCAALNGDVKMLKFLLSHGANVKIEDDNGNTPLHLAAGSGFLKIAELLIDIGADVNAMNDSEDMPFYLAVRGDHYEVGRILADHGARPEVDAEYLKTLFMDFISSRNEKGVNCLIRFGLDVNLRNQFGESLLQMVVDLSFDEAVVLLIDAGADVNERTGSFPSPLYYAICNDDLEMAKLLIKRGAKACAEEYFGETGLHYAVWFNNIDITKLLLEHGAEVNARDNKGRTPLHWAAEDMYSEISKYLLDEGADVNSLDIYGETPLDRANSEEVKSILRSSGAKTGAELKAAEEKKK